MYSRILVPLENSPYDPVILAHVRALAKHCGASLVLIHVADGWAARNMDALQLRESAEIREDRVYLDTVCAELNAAGIQTEALLASGDPAAEISSAADREKCDLIAMATHGHKLLADVILGSVASAVRHRSMIPVLLVRGVPATGAPGSG